MTPRVNEQTAITLVKPLVEFAMKVADSGLEHSLGELVKIRASQINGCARCLHMHTLDARRAGETEERLYLIAAWRDSPLFSPRERAALAWTEALTLIADTRAPDEDYRALQAEFSEEEQIKLSMLIVAINSFNRLSVGFRFTHPVAANTRAA
jgi:AhpD family alkylhydroperoxidase